MTIVVSWISREREFPTLWTVADTRLSQSIGMGVKPLLDCGSKLFSVRVACIGPNQNGYFSDDVYFSTTIGMSFAGSSLLALNLHAFISYTLGNIASGENVVPSMNEIAEHINACFESVLNNYIETNFKSTLCEISIFGYCHTSKQHRLFHVKHEGKDKSISFSEFKFINDNSIHLMGDHKDDIHRLIKSNRKGLIGKKFWRSPKGTIENII